MNISQNWQHSPQALFNKGPIIPVLVINKVEDALPIAEALLESGIRVLEVTLRTPQALEAIQAISTAFPEAIVGSGTVINRELLQLSADAGAQFAISPGLTLDLLKAGNEGNIALIPGISSISELMNGIDLGYQHFKFFPAEASGGTKALQSISGPFPDIRFCPTGGINLNNINSYLALSNVSCCGGSWLVSDTIIHNKNWKAISQLSYQALEKTKQVKLN